MRIGRRKIAYCCLLLFVLLGLFAPWLAGARPLMLSYKGDLHFLPAESDLEKLAGKEWRVSLKENMNSSDWAIWRPVRYDPNQVRTQGEIKVLNAPSKEHLLGSDDRGRDVLSRLIHGSQTTLLLALLTTLLSLALGIGLTIFDWWTPDMSIQLPGDELSLADGSFDYPVALPSWLCTRPHGTYFKSNGTYLVVH